jgi:molybdenum cofactor guanylyltransferase
MPSDAAPLSGLVLAGGRSQRMGSDKALLAYHGKPQVEYALDLLAPHCAQRFVSCRAEQGAQAGLAGLPQIHDSFFDLGPLGGILSALAARPGSAFLVIACDLPFLDAATLSALVAGRDPTLAATAFQGYQDLPEPVCAVYEPAALPRFLELVDRQGIRCPRKALINSSIRLLSPPDPLALTNANRPEEYQRAMAALAGNRLPSV